MTRSAFLRRLAAFLAVPLFIRRLALPAWAAPPRPWREELDGFLDKHRDDIRALSAVLLAPASGDGFVEWLRGYDPEAEKLSVDWRPGRKLGPLPLWRYESQLESLKRSAGRDRLLDVPAGELKALVLHEMEQARPRHRPARDDLYGVPDGRDLFRDMLVVFLKESRTLDLCYRRDIGIFTCRGLDGLG